VKKFSYTPSSLSEKFSESERALSGSCKLGKNKKKIRRSSGHGLKEIGAEKKTKMLRSRQLIPVFFRESNTAKNGNCVKRTIT